MRSSRNKIKKIVTILIGMVFLGLFWIVYSKVLIVNKVTWNLNGIDCATVSDLEKNINLKGKPLLKLNSQEFETILIYKYPCIKSLSIINNLNGDVVVDLSSRQPFLNLMAFSQQPLDVLNNKEASVSTETALVDYSIPNDSAGSFLVDDQGVVYKIGNGEYPSLYITNRRIKVGDHLDLDTISAVKVIVVSIPQIGFGSMINFSALNQLKIKIQDQDIIVLTDPILLLSLSKPTNDVNKDIYNSLISLQLILKTAKMENRAIKSVDLRFDKPVVEYKL